MPSPEIQIPDDSKVRLPRAAIDMNMPLAWLLGLAGVALWLGVSMYFQLDTLKAGMDEVKATLKASNAMTSQLVSEQTLIKYRLEKLEAAKAEHK